MKTLVIVESPTKARTITRYLGDDFVIKYSMGHIMDLPKSTLGVDVEHDFKPALEVIADKKKLIAELKAAAKGADQIILATDPDREGEAIAANIKQVLEGIKGTRSIKSTKGRKASDTHDTPDTLDTPRFQRIVFHEITEEAIKDAIKHPRDVDMNLVDAQTARRILDRLVGYTLSPLLWQKVRRGLSAGRVQSVALRVIVEREKEIEKFQKEPYFSVHAMMTKKAQSVIASRFPSTEIAKQSVEKKIATSSGHGGTPRNDDEPVEFDLVETDQKKIEIQQSYDLYDGKYTISKTSVDTVEKAEKIAEDIRKRAFVISSVNEKQAKRSPAAPFTTSTLQQDASRRYGYSGKRTMSLAQKLYEEGFITYHRTDSTTLAPVAITQIRSFVQKTYGDRYIPEKPRLFLTKQKSAQEAHEAIRPTKFGPLQGGHIETIEGQVGKDCAKLYELIWRRAVGSQMADALTQSTTVFADSVSVIASEAKQSYEKKIATSSGHGGTPRNDSVSYRLKASGSVLVFDGFLVINPQALQDRNLPQFIVNEDLDVKKVTAEAHETPAPPRYNDASIIATLEEKGIGRPSTYASIISTLVDRAYVERLEKRFEATSVGVAVNDFLVANFGDIDDIPFTAGMEDKLDLIASGNKNWVAMMREFYEPLAKKLDTVKSADRVKIKVESTGEMCPQCGNPIVVRTGKFGKFLSCSTFPECKFTKPFIEETNVACPKDGDTTDKPGRVIVKKTKKGRKFYGCSNYPDCTFAAWKLEDINKPVLSS